VHGPLSSSASTIVLLSTLYPPLRNIMPFCFFVKEEKVNKKIILGPLKRSMVSTCHEIDAGIDLKEK
jgi:hypothetical protein